MKAFFCSCGQRVFFENDLCMRCGAELGFDPRALVLVAVQPAGEGRLNTPNGVFRHCGNREAGVCNWLIPDDEPGTLCLACGLNEIIPALDTPGNRMLWTRLEQAKRRLMYTLLSLGLPVRGTDTLPPLRFRFLEDQRSNPEVFEQFVSTGHRQGTITINVAEADNVARTRAQEMMLERYRTLLGHFRHEIAHYYFDYLMPDDETRAEFRGLFGDERQDYQSALKSHYDQGPPPQWHQHFVSAYAAAHPHEDWAESFAHFLHVVDALETASDMGLTSPGMEDAQWLSRWMQLAVGLNELNRSLGAEDPYPFVFTDTITAKLDFIRRRVAAMRARSGTAASATPQTPV